MNNINLAKIYDLIIKTGLSKFREKNSKASLPALIKADREECKDKKGAIFAVRSKADFTTTGVKGYIITSKETLLEDAKNLTHFTPNVYRTFGYADKKRRYIMGHEENHLLQVNTFVIDIDTKKFTVQDILLACLDESVGAPTLVIESDRGYQVHFVLDKPIFISNKRNFLSLTVAKRISENLKKSLINVAADLYCNDFGFFRLPKNDNVVWFNENAVYSTKELIDWSERKDNDTGRLLYIIPSKLSKNNVMQSDWFHALVTATDVKGKKGQLGRNNLLFTLALVCLQDGETSNYAFDLLDQVNSNLRYALKINQVSTIVKSAYSGKYKGAKKEYIENLLSEYVVGQFEVKMNTTGWYKHAKAREARERSHGYEWEQDIINYIEKHINTNPFVKISQKELCLALNMPQSTLNEVFKSSTRILKRVDGAGRGAKTLLTTVAAFIKHAIQNVREMKQEYADKLKQLVTDTNFISSPAIARVFRYIDQLTAPPNEELDNVVYLFGNSS